MAHAEKSSPPMNEATSRNIVLARYPGARLVTHQPVGKGRSYRVEAGAAVLGEGKGPALAWRGAARRVLGDAQPMPTPPDELVRRAVAHLVEARTLLESAGRPDALAKVRAAIDAAGVRPAVTDN